MSETPKGNFEKDVLPAPQNDVMQSICEVAWNDSLDHDGLKSVDVDMFVREASVRALSNIRDRGIKPTMISSDLMSLMRG